MFYEYGMGPHLMHGFGHFLFILLMIAGIFMLIRYFKRGKYKGYCHEKSEAMTLLETRYVQGEIDRDEYMAKKDDLEGKIPIGETT
ncbi:MAG: SHOCT domain-containing protein [Alphaproteobacteria bacterium]|nr:SHOCT domain-containing protein [Rhodospirillales bacterium]MCW9044838.1 SHOCT domain-containing protein [Alphaproteobacteria bacterium]